MPTLLTHKIAADNILKELQDTDAQRVIEANKSAYYSGSQGGDIFLTHKFYFFLAAAKSKMLGWALHYTRPQRFFCEGAEYIKENGNDLLKSYFYGYITHYCLDMVLHPKINRETKPMSTHNILECALDIYYAKKNGIDAYSFNKEQFAKDARVYTTEIDDFLKHMSYLFIGLKMNEFPYQIASEYYIYYNRLMSQPTLKNRIKLRLMNVVSQVRIDTLLYKPLSYYDGLYDYDYYLQLIDRAADLAEKRIRLTDEYFAGKREITELESEFYNISFHGKSILPLEERKAFKELYKKTPIE